MRELAAGGSHGGPIVSLSSTWRSRCPPRTRASARQYVEAGEDRTNRPYDPAWPARYDKEAARVIEALGARVVVIEHIGSTAVPGVAAKPTIDILVGVGALTEIDDSAETQMAEIGYELRGEVGVPGRRYFRKGESFPRESNVHVFEFGGPLWRSNIAFRDYLRAHPPRGRGIRIPQAEPGFDARRSGAGGLRGRKTAFIAEIARRASLP